ncbi:MAG TPA: F0F1 ATP synthase subunit alpha, partial [Gemmata sp.]|nr:F0F1 ATP synthase subunit alpha [Gemmata sp.]
MTERVESLGDRIRSRLEQVGWEVRHREVGNVIRVGDGVAYLSGMPSVKYGELLACQSGLTALAFDLRPSEVGALFLGPADKVAAGDEVRLTGRVASVPVGGGLIGRVIDPLGNPLDGRGPVRSEAIWPVEREAPGVADRQPVTEPLLTGTKVIDALLPIGRGQRELILGDRATGKTTIALDAILAQRRSGVKCIFVSIGERKAALAEVVDTLSELGALEYTAVVAAEADAAPGLQYLAPFAGCTIGEYFMHQGGHVLIVYDDLTRHADAYRRICLLLGRPPGREAYPADVFYLHARLLERATKLHDRLGAGSLSALPIAATQAGNVAAYIPTNLISITDGQIYLNTRLFNEGQRPAVDVGLSVSRVGGKAQPPVLRRVVGDLKLLYSQLPELESFTRFGADLEPQTRQRLVRGRTLREILKQRPHRPRRLGQLVAGLFAVREGLLDSLPVSRTAGFFAPLASLLEETESELLEALEGATEMHAELADHLRKVIERERDA